MLNDQAIPQKEPEISVGIILPEDEMQQVIVNIPNGEYSIVANDKSPTIITESMKITFATAGNKVCLQMPDGTELCADSLHIRQNTELPMRKNAGVLVHGVIAGRDFHWKKNIDVFLPGHMEVKQADGQLILINHLPFEHYLMCVATSEMGAACPAALIESQTIAARSWMLANVEKKHRHLGMDVCNDDCCQRYQGTNFLTEQSIAGARNSHGIVAMFENTICDARYSKSCGGMMESFPTIWDGDDLPYMQVKRDILDQVEEQIDLTSEDAIQTWLDSEPLSFCSPQTIPEYELIKYLGGVDEEGHYYRWHYHFSQVEMTAVLNKTLSLGAQKILKIETGERGGSGRLKSIDIFYLDKEGIERNWHVKGDVAIRAALHDKFLFSSAITITALPAASSVPKEFVIRGAGWGHGAGLCQIGALGMSLKNHSTEAIILHYYPGSKLVKIY